MYLSSIARISLLPTYFKLQFKCNGAFSRTASRLYSCNFEVASRFVNKSQTHFDMDGTVQSIRSTSLERLINTCRSNVTSKSRDYQTGLLSRSTFSLRCNQVRTICSSQWRQKKEEITVNFLNRDGETLTVKAKVGETLLDTVIDNDVDIDGFGACEGTLACSTCHLIFDEDIFETLPEKLDEEEDMLDLAYGLEDTSRLGCQICLTKEMDGMVVRVPEGISDARDV